MTQVQKTLAAREAFYTVLSGITRLTPDEFHQIALTATEWANQSYSEGMDMGLSIARNFQTEPIEPESTFDQHIPAPHKLNGIDGDTLILCETEFERESVLQTLSDAGMVSYGKTCNLGDAFSTFNIAPDVYVRNDAYFDTAYKGLYDNLLQIPASQFLALNTPSPSTHSANA